MRLSKIIAILGAILIVVCFFLPWESMSVMGEDYKYSGYQKASGNIPNYYDLMTEAYENDEESDPYGLDFMFDELMGDMMGDALDVPNKLLNPINYVFPGAAILVMLFSLLSNRKPHISYGIVLVLLSIGLGILLLLVNNIDSVMSLELSIFGIEDLLPTTKYEIGYYGTFAGLFVFLIAGFLSWQDYSKESKAPAYSSFQNAPGYGYQDQNYPQQYPAYQQQMPQPQRQPGDVYSTNNDASAFLYQQNSQYQNYQQSAPAPQQPPYNPPPAHQYPPQPGYQATGAYQQPPYSQPQPQPQPQPYPQQPPYDPPPAYQTPPQPGYQATGAYQQPPYHQPQPQPQPQPYPQQPTPPPPNIPEKPVAGWRPIRPPEDPKE